MATMLADCHASPPSLPCYGMPVPGTHLKAEMRCDDASAIDLHVLPARRCHRVCPACLSKPEYAEYVLVHLGTS
eukprot:15481410-Alexandrium_andersonii.AAC.1